MTKREEDKLYKAATKRFIAKWNEIFSTRENTENAIKARKSFTDKNGNSDQLFLLNGKVCYQGNENDQYYFHTYQINKTITQYFDKETADTLSIDSKIILDAAIHGALAAAKKDRAYNGYIDDNDNWERRKELNTRFDNLPKTAFKTIDIDLLLLEMMTNDLISLKGHTDLTDALTTLTTQLNTNPNPTITKATITLLRRLTPDLIDEQTEEDKLQIAQIFTEYETACKTTSASKNVLKAVGVVIITGICFAAGIVAGAVLGGAVGLAAGSWSGPGAAFSAILGVFKGSLTGWAMAATATAAVTGVVFGTAGAASSTSSLFFKPSAVDKAVADIVALSPKIDDKAESNDDTSHKL